jgi:hypothetical protein
VVPVAQKPTAAVERPATNQEVAGPTGRPQGTAPAERSVSGGALKDALLVEVKKEKAVFYNTVIAQAQKIEVDGDRIRFTFSPAHGLLRGQLEQNRAWLESIAARLAGRRLQVQSIDAAPEDPAAAPVDPAEARRAALKAEAMADSAVQALLDVFPSEIRDVEEM